MNAMNILLAGWHTLLKTLAMQTIPRITGILLLGFLSTLMPSAEAANVKFLTIVSLTFDDGLRQSAAIQPLLDNGLKGTFYINSDQIRLSGVIDNNDYLTKGELNTLFNNGHDIGGHTINHVNLGTLSDTAQRQAICDDLVALRNWYGDSVYSFAYPYSSTGPTTQSILAGGCPGTYGSLNKPVGTYQSARAVGGIACANCPFAESLTPHNPYFLGTTESLASTNTLADMQNYVTQAELNGGGWVILVFHAICDGCADNLRVTPSNLRALLEWLKVREPQGTYVRTVHQVMSGDYPPPPQPAPLGPNLLINPSLELDLDSNNQPDCWERNGWGTNTPLWTRTTDAFSGNFAQALQITAYTNGDRKLMSTLDADQLSGGCAPPVEAGALYQLSAYYKSTTTSTVVLFYLDATGTWQYWRDGPVLPASNVWTRMIHYSGPLPAGAQALSFGIALTGIGTLTTDEYAMAKVLDTPPPPPTNTAPNFTGGTTALTIAMNSPAVDLKANLHVSDTDAGQTETWSTSTAPVHGTLIISGATANSGSANITPAGTLTYQPAAGYSGADSFTVQVSDGTASATRTFSVTVTNTQQGANLLINPSLELDQDNNSQADCWERDSWGTNTAIWTRTTDAFTGSFAQKLQISAYTNGDRKLLPALDAGQLSGGCAPSLEANAVYRISAYYKSTATATVALFYHDANNVWQYWRDGPSLAATNVWTQMTHDTGPLPAGAKAMSFGIALTGVGTLTTDEYSMAKILNSPPPANIAPTFTGGTTVLSMVQGRSAVNLKANLHVSDTDTGQTETWSPSVLPAQGTLAIAGATANSGSTNITPNGTLIYQPPNNYSGPANFTVQVSDSIASANRAFSVTVTANTAPVFVGGSTALTVARNSAATNLKANLHVSDTDIGQTETWSTNVAPAHGALTISASAKASGSANITPAGTLTYKPTTNYRGADSFTVQVSDGVTVATRSFSVTVQ